MAPRTLHMVTCFNIPAKEKLPAQESIAFGPPKKKLPVEEAIGSAKKRPWTCEIKRKILASVRRERITPARKEEEPCDVDAEKQRTATQRTRTPLKRGIIKGPRHDGSPEAIVAVDGERKRKGLRVRFDLPIPKEEIAAAPVKPPPFPKGVMGQPPAESFKHSGPEMTAAFLASVIAAADVDSATPVDHDEIVARRKQRMEACSRRLRYLKDYCPFRREEGDEEEDEESTPETTTTVETDHAEEALPRVKTGLLFDSGSEAGFVKAIRSGYLLKDDFVSRRAYERSRDQYYSCNRIA